MRLAKHAIALAAALLAAAPAAAQNGVIHGQVIDARGGQPVPNAAVYLGNHRAGVVADAQGRFEIKNVRPGTRVLWASSPGYTMDMASLDVAAGENTVRLEMVSNPVRLQALTVTTSRLDRRLRAYPSTARVFRESDMTVGWYRSVLDLLETRGGVHTTSCVASYTSFASTGGSDCIYSRGSRYAPRVYVDESPWIGGMRSLENFQIAEVARVEVFGNGREVHVYTRQFMDWASRRAYVPAPIGIF